jgi:tRNA A37 threonylcarbamoyladenosine biosynthesis protein TsaE
MICDGWLRMITVVHCVVVLVAGNTIMARHLLSLISPMGAGKMYLTEVLAYLCLMSCILAPTYISVL